MRITKTFVDKVTLPQVPSGAKQAQQFYRDSAMPGFGLRVMNTGVKSFIVEKRINGKVKRITLGRYGNLTVEQARKEAVQWLGQVASGKDPIAEKNDGLLRGVTLQAVFDAYLQTRKDLKETTIKDYTRCMTWGFSDWLNKSVTEISKDMVEARHRKLGQSSHARANNALRVLRALFNFVRHKYEDSKGNPLILVNPTERISQTRGWYKVQRRTTLIKPHQLNPWYSATLKLTADTTKDYLHFLLFTGLRRSEASKLSGVPFTLHDLRRTFITIAESLNIPAYALKKLLNHKDTNDVTAGYIISDVERLRLPMQQISHYILSQINDDVLRNESTDDVKHHHLSLVSN